MKILENKRVQRSYSPTGPMARAALDFFSERGMCYDFDQDFRFLPVDEQQRRIIDMFAERQATEAIFSFLTPEPKYSRQTFTIKFACRDNGRVPYVEIVIKSVAKLREQAKLYPRDATAYAGVRKVRSKARAIDSAL